MMLEIYWACELHTADVSFGTWQAAAVKGRACFVLVTCTSDILLLCFIRRWDCDLQLGAFALFLSLFSGLS